MGPCVPVSVLDQTGATLSHPGQHRVFPSLRNSTGLRKSMPDAICHSGNSTSLKNRGQGACSRTKGCLCVPSTRASGEPDLEPGVRVQMITEPGHCCVPGMDQSLTCPNSLGPRLSRLSGSTGGKLERTCSIACFILGTLGGHSRA